MGVFLAQKTKKTPTLGVFSENSGSIPPLDNPKGPCDLDTPGLSTRTLGQNIIFFREQRSGAAFCPKITVFAEEGNFC